MDTNQLNYLTEICVQVRQIRLYVVTGLYCGNFCVVNHLES